MIEILEPRAHDGADECDVEYRVRQDDRVQPEREIEQGVERQKGNRQNDIRDDHGRKQYGIETAGRFAPFHAECQQRAQNRGDRGRDDGDNDCVDGGGQDLRAVGQLDVPLQGETGPGRGHAATIETEHHEHQYGQIEKREGQPEMRRQDGSGGRFLAMGTPPIALGAIYRDRLGEQKQHHDEDQHK